ncbi:MAG TPA: hypothetical protein PKL83_03860 [bacterium]|nr:hypothetical protein [bacterium]
MNKKTVWVVIVGGLAAAGMIGSMLLRPAWFEQLFAGASRETESNTPADHDRDTDASSAETPLSPALADPLSPPLIQPDANTGDDMPGEAVAMTLDTQPWATQHGEDQQWSMAYPENMFVYTQATIPQQTIFSNKAYAGFEPGGCYAQGTCELDSYGADLDWFVVILQYEEVPVDVWTDGGICTDTASCIIGQCEKESACQYPHPGGIALPFAWVDSTPLECCNDAYYRAPLADNDWVLSLPADYGGYRFLMYANGRLYTVQYLSRHIVDTASGMLIRNPQPEPELYQDIFRQMLASFQTV